MTRHPAPSWPLVVFAALLLATALVACDAPFTSIAPGISAPAAAPAEVRPQASAASAPPTAQAATAATALPTAAAPASPTPVPETRGASSRVVLGYYVPYDATSWASFKAQATSLDYVAGQWATVDACGNVSSRDDRTLIAYAGERGVKVLPSLLTSSGWLNHRLLTDRVTSDRFLDQIVAYVEEMGYPGFDLDLEGIDAGDRDAFSAFVARLADALHSRGRILTLAIPAKISDVRTGWAGPYDYAALGKHADLILLMTYDYSWSSGPPGSIAPQEWVDKVAAYAASQMPAEKLLIGVAFYGYDWNTTMGGRAKALLYSQAAALAKQQNARILTDKASRSGTFSYTARPGDLVPPPPSLPAIQHDIAIRTSAQCEVRPPVTPTPTPRPTSTPAPLQEHVVWLEDATSVAGRLQIAAQRGAAGVGTWRLGQEDPEVWPLLSAFRAGR